MLIKRYKAEQIMTILRQIEVGIANGKLTPQELARKLKSRCRRSTAGGSNTVA
jgi:hypothetical protein